MTAREPIAERPRSARFPVSIDARLVAMAEQEGRPLSEVLADVVRRGLDAPAVLPTVQTISDGDRLRAAMAKASMDSTTLAVRLGFSHRSAVANVLRTKGPAPLQGRLLAWVESQEGARK